MGARGMKVYRGNAAAARNYVEADRSRADDYYLAESTGLAARYVATPPDGVREAAAMDGPTYEQWVAGYDLATGTAKGRLRTDDQAVRFVEVTVTGRRPGRSRPRCNHPGGAARAAGSGAGRGD